MGANVLAVDDRASEDTRDGEPNLINDPASLCREAVYSVFLKAGRAILIKNAWLVISQANNAKGFLFVIFGGLAVVVAR